MIKDKYRLAHYILSYFNPKNETLQQEEKQPQNICA